MPVKISVVMPVYNGQRYICEALESLYAQHYSNLEIIVVDDGSTDETPGILQKQGESIRIVRQANQGPAAAVNTGIRLAKGDFLGFLDADDRWHPTLVESLFPRLLESPMVDIVTGMTQRYLFDKPVGEAHRGLYFAASLFRREVFERVGLINESLIFSEDADWFFRALECGVRIEFSSEIVFHYRQHDQNLTADRDATFQGYLHALKRRLDRLRHQDSLKSDRSDRPLR